MERDNREEMAAERARAHQLGWGNSLNYNAGNHLTTL